MRCQDARSLIISKLNSTNLSHDERILRIHNIEQLSLKTYIRGLTGQLQNNIRLRNPTTLENAMALVVEEENFLYCQGRNNSLNIQTYKPTPLSPLRVIPNQSNNRPINYQNQSPNNPGNIFSSPFNQRQNLYNPQNNIFRQPEPIRNNFNQPNQFMRPNYPNNNFQNRPMFQNQNNFTRNPNSFSNRPQFQIKRPAPNSSNSFPNQNNNFQRSNNFNQNNNRPEPMDTSSGNTFIQQNKKPKYMIQ